MQTVRTPRLCGSVRPEKFGGLLFCVEPMRILAFNHSGYQLACLIDGRRKFDEIAVEFAKRLVLPLTTVQSDVDAFLGLLDSEGLLV